ncbi:MAG: hypothetical protein JXA77_11750 [Bacteroidales bacterium]|nr:hypothetical protein [Bacteroidales bacterium]MBN2818036.1 hypothetical protein [Bacteroidales bacterium]
MYKLYNSGLIILILFFFQVIKAQDKKILVNNQQRAYSISVPKSYNGEIAVPLVFILHGYDNDVKSIKEYSGFNELSEKEGVITVYPYGSKNENDYYVWNAGNQYQEWSDNADDVSFISTLIDSIKENYSIDTSAIYLIGHSNGAMMCYKLAAALSGKIAAVACLSGPMIDESKIPEYPVAVMHIHGDNDIIIPHTGTEQYGFKLPPIDHVIRNWLKWNNCSSVPAVLNYSKKVTALQWKGDKEVRFYLLHGAGHNWPSKASSGWEASEFIWEFFKQNKKG